MSSKIIIITTLFLLLVGFSVLYVIETKNHGYDYKKSWSVVYFDNPRDNSLDFTIENHQEEEVDYKYKVYANEEKVIESEVEIEAGAKQKIEPVIDIEKLGDNSRVMIDVSYKGTDYKIYKDLGK